MLNLDSFQNFFLAEKGLRAAAAVLNNLQLNVIDQFIFGISNPKHIMILVFRCFTVKIYIENVKTGRLLTWTG